MTKPTTTKTLTYADGISDCCDVLRELAINDGLISTDIENKMLSKVFAKHVVRNAQEILDSAVENMKYIDFSCGGTIKPSMIVLDPLNEYLVHKKYYDKMTGKDSK